MTQNKLKSKLFDLDEMLFRFPINNALLKDEIKTGVHWL